MKIHWFHLTPTGLARAWGHLRAGRMLCKRFGARLGKFIPSSINSMTPAWNFFLTMDSLKLPMPETIIDVGANQSQMTKLLILPCSSEVDIHSFEPNPALTPVGRKHEIALSDTDGTANFSIPENDTGWGTIDESSDSIDERTRHFPVKLARLESLAEDGTLDWKSLQKPILVKIDTEGNEFKALKGFGDCLKDVSYLVIEVDNPSGNDDHYSMIEFCGHLSDFGFNKSKVLFACHNGPFAPAYMDMMFWKE